MVSVGSMWFVSFVAVVGLCLTGVVEGKEREDSSPMAVLGGEWNSSTFIVGKDGRSRELEATTARYLVFPAEGSGGEVARLPGRIFEFNGKEIEVRQREVAIVFNSRLSGQVLVADDDMEETDDESDIRSFKTFLSFDFKPLSVGRWSSQVNRSPNFFAFPPSLSEENENAMRQKSKSFFRSADLHSRFEIEWTVLMLMCIQQGEWTDGSARGVYNMYVSKNSEASITFTDEITGDMFTTIIERMAVDLPQPFWKQYGMSAVMILVFIGSKIFRGYMMKKNGRTPAATGAATSTRATTGRKTN